MSRPPRLSRWLLERALPDDVREDVSGDLEEMFHRRRRTEGPGSARRWYRRQAAAFSLRFLAERLRERRRQVDMRTGFSLVDFKLAVRMLVRYPGLTIVGAIGMAVGIAIATAGFAIMLSLLDGRVPLDEGDRVVSIAAWDAATNNREGRLLADFAVWRELDALEDVGAFRTVGRNLIAAGAQPETVTLVEMTASGFDVARVQPLLGRHLLADDERPDAPPVVVIGHDVWTRRFSSDPAILGREIQLGGTAHTIVGVMPEGFAFPINHSYWIPWRLDPSAYEPRTGPAVNVFGRLAPGATLESAQAQLTAVARRMAAEHPRTHEHLRARVLPYTYAFNDMDDPENALVLAVIQTAIVLLLVLVCVNVAILVYARTATRQGEIAVRSALGASRRRIVAQLFLEALVLAGVASVAGVGLAAVALRQLEGALLPFMGRMPFWMQLTLPAESAIYVAALTILAAAIVGIVPALKATGRQVHARLQGLSAGSGSRMQMGRLWTALIVAQVGITVAVLPGTLYHTWSSLRFRTGDLGLATQEFLSTDLVLDRMALVPPPAPDDPAFRQRYALRQTELERRLEADPAVADVTFSMARPGEEWAVVLDVEGAEPPTDLTDYNIVEGSRRGHLVRFNRVSLDFFDTYGMELLAGRGFDAGDLVPLAGRAAASPVRGSSAAAVVVDRALAEQLFGGSNPLGRRIRYVGRSREADQADVALERWYEIVGVVETFPPYGQRGALPRVYHPAAPGEIYPAVAALRVRGSSPMAFAPRLREISAATDPDLQLRNLSSVEEALKREQRLMRLIGATTGAVMLSVVVLSGAGIYALMSFTVSRRRREIGIRAALGADPAQILAGIFSRAFRQLAAGAVVGLAGAAALEQVLGGEMFQGHGAVLLPLVIVIMTGVGLLAALGPARRGLQIQPIEALREE